MSGPACSKTSRSWPLGLLGMLVLVTLAEWQWSRLDVDLTPIWAADWRQAGKAARKEATDCEVLCFGDSLAKLGLVPRILEQESGQSAYNLAVSVGQVPASYFLLRRALDAGAKPKAIVIDLIPHLLAEGPRYNARQWADFIQLGECLDLALTAQDPEFFASTLLARALPSVRCRYEIRAAIRGKMRGEHVSNFPAIAWHWRNWRINRGAQIMPPVTDFEGDAELWPAELYPESWTVHPVNQVYLDRFLKLAAEQNVPVYWIIMPFSSEVQTRREALGLDKQYTAFAHQMQKRYAHLVVLDARQSGYDHPVHIDPIHLDRRGAEALSVDLAQILKMKHLTNRWLPMPPFQYRPEGDLIEDLDQSQLALEVGSNNPRR